MAKNISVFEFNSLPPELQQEIVDNLPIEDINKSYVSVRDPDVRAGMREKVWLKLYNTEDNIESVVERLVDNNDVDGLLYIDNLYHDIPWDHALSLSTNYDNVELFKQIYEVWSERSDNDDLILDILDDVIPTGRTEIFKYLYSLGFRVGEPDSMKSALYAGNLELAEWLYQQGEQIHLEYFKDAIYGDERASAEWLVSKGLNPLDYIFMK